MKIGFIGAGAMGGAIMKGLVAAGYPAGQICCSDHVVAAAEQIEEETGIRAYADNAEVVKNADAVVFAVKPWILPDVLKELCDLLVQKNSLVISIAAGVSLETLKDYAGGADLPIVRVIPSISTMVGAGINGICVNENVSREQSDAVIELFQSVGAACLLEEKDFDCFSVISSASPAFTCMYIDALSRGGVKNGLSKAVATKTAAEAVMGTAELILKTGKIPWEIVDSVCSPGGCTVAGVYSLEADAMPASVMRCVDVTLKAMKGEK